MDVVCSNCGKTGQFTKFCKYCGFPVIQSSPQLDTHVKIILKTSVHELQTAITDRLSSYQQGSEKNPYSEGDWQLYQRILSFFNLLDNSL